MSYLIGLLLLSASLAAFIYPLLAMYSWGWMALIFVPINWIGSACLLALGLSIIVWAVEADKDDVRTRYEELKQSRNKSSSGRVTEKER